MTQEARSAATPSGLPELEGAQIQYVEQRDDGRIVLVYGYRGTDDGNGYLVVDAADIHSLEGGVYDDQAHH